MGTLVDTQTILTAAHNLILNDTIVTDDFGNSQTSIIPNSFYPSIGSMYNVYLGIQSISNDLTNATNISVSNLIQVGILFLAILYIFST